MSLPKIQSSLFELTIPTTKKKITFRPFTVKEEKILLFAKQSGEQKDIERAVKQIVTNCVQDNIDIDDLSKVDLTYIFLKIRAKSADNIIKLKYRDLEDEEVREFAVDLESIEVTFSENYDNKIRITPEIGIVMKAPTIEISEKLEHILQNEEDKDRVEKFLDEFILNCIERIYDSESVYLVKDYTKEELLEFMNGLPSDVYPKLTEFFNSLPKIEYVIEYENKNNTKRSIILSNVSDFFT